MTQERVQKIISQAGVASRRKAEELIKDGLVTINGKRAKLGDKASWGSDAIKVSGKLITRPEVPVYIAFYKPKNVLSTMEKDKNSEQDKSRDPRKTLADYFKRVKSKIFPIGRMDFKGEGLILMTNDGEMAATLQRNKEIIRTYSVKINGHPNEKQLRQLERGGRVGQKLLRPHSFTVTEQLQRRTKFEISFKGMNAVDLREYFEDRNFPVERVLRSAIGQITLRGLRPGEYRRLKRSQIEALIKNPLLGEKTRIHSAPKKKKPRPESSKQSRPSSPKKPAPRGKKLQVKRKKTRR